jgi:hypothetical protein
LSLARLKQNKMASESSASSFGHSGGQVPVLPRDEDPDLHYVKSRDMITAYLSALSKSVDIMVDPARQAPVGDVWAAGLSTAQRGRLKEDWDLFREHVLCEKKGTAALLIFVGKNEAAYKLLSNQKSAVKAAAVQVNQMAIMINPLHVPVIAVMPTCLQQLDTLDAHFNPQNELMGSVRYEALLTMKIAKAEPLTKAIVRVQNQIHRMDAVRPNPLSLAENRSHLERMLARSEEQELQILASSLQMAQQDLTWIELCRLVSRFDHLTLGVKRLEKKAGGDTLMGLERDPGENEKKRKTCHGCNKVGHSPEKCWTLHPNLLPDYVKKKQKKREEAGKQPTFKFSKNNDKGEVITLLEWDSENEEELEYQLVSRVTPQTVPTPIWPLAVPPVSRESRCSTPMASADAGWVQKESIPRVQPPPIKIRSVVRHDAMLSSAEAECPGHVVRALREGLRLDRRLDLLDLKDCFLFVTLDVAQSPQDGTLREAISEEMPPVRKKMLRHLLSDTIMLLDDKGDSDDDSMPELVDDPSDSEDDDDFMPGLLEEDTSDSEDDDDGVLLQLDEDDDVHEPTILFDSGASKNLFIVTDLAYLERATETSASIGTAHQDGHLKIVAVGWIGQQKAFYCPNLRHAVIALGRFHSWGYDVRLPHHGVLELYHGTELVLSGVYQRGMPVFPLADILQIARAQGRQTMMALDLDPDYHDDEDHGSRSDSGEGTTETMGLGDTGPTATDPTALAGTGAPVEDGVLPQHHLNDHDKVRLLHKRFHVPLKKLTEMYRKELVSGITVPRAMLGARAISKMPPCDDCRVASQRRHQYHTHVTRFDMTTAGMRRLIKNPVVNSLEDTKKTRDKRKRYQHPLCAECDKRHGGTDFWKTHPKLKPDWMKKREEERNK